LNPFVLLLLFYSVKQQNNKTKGIKQKDSNNKTTTLTKKALQKKLFETKNANLTKNA
jgi:hypothetical protein